ncbi:MAG TPA: SDR family NAD(P)-dependent oxidoreductase [Candidatus Egerieousia sp.]|nr:SDR family NAD(P)-dependent oxidoreductase [Candidatus Egerieousia sp.]HPT06053.1 SDR family NAD(P)-dependent oxidoreductase [Candidatus Egerieousia sp.]
MKKKVVIMGATSGVGKMLAIRFLQDGFIVGAAGRRAELLEELKNQASIIACTNTTESAACCRDRCFTKVIDINEDTAVGNLKDLISEMGGMDIYCHVSGIGFYNPELEEGRELSIVQTNCLGFSKMIGEAFRYFALRREAARGGALLRDTDNKAVSPGCFQIAAVSSIAGTKGIGVAAAYSASKRFQSNYLQSLSQLSKIRRLGISITDIKPGFMRTALLKDDRYPMIMKPEYAVPLIYKAIRRRRRARVIDWRYAVLAFFWRIIPRNLWERLRVKI